MVENKGPYDFRNLLTVLFKHKKKVVAVYLLAGAAILIAIHVQPSYYDVHSVIMVKYGREYLPVAEANDFKYPALGYEAIVNTEIQILTSHDLLSEVVSTVGPRALYPDLPAKLKTSELADAATLRFRDDLTVKAVPLSNAVEITLRNKSREAAGCAADVLLNILMVKHLKVFSGSKSSFLEDQVKLYRDKARESEVRLAEFKNAHNITSLKDQYFYIVGKHTELEATLRFEQSRLAELKEKLAFLKTQRRNVVEDLYTNSTRKTMTDLKAKESVMLQTYREDSLPVRNLRKEMETIQTSLHKYEEENKASGEWVTVQAELQPQQIKINSLKEQIGRFDRQLQELTMAEDEMNRLDHDLSLNQANYETYLKKLEEARISDDMDRHKLINISVIEPPAASLSAEKATTRKILGIGLFLAVALSFGLVFLLEGATQRMTTPENARKLLGLRVLVAVPHKG